MEDNIVILINVIEVLVGGESYFEECWMCFKEFFVCQCGFVLVVLCCNDDLCLLFCFMVSMIFCMQDQFWGVLQCNEIGDFVFSCFLVYVYCFGQVFLCVQFGI